MVWFYYNNPVSVMPEVFKYRKMQNQPQINESAQKDALPLEPKKLTPHFSFEYLLLFSDNSFEKSPSFPAELFLK